MKDFVALLPITLWLICATVWPPAALQQQEKSCEDKVFELIHECMNKGGVYPQECFSDDAVMMLDSCLYTAEEQQEEEYEPTC